MKVGDLIKFESGHPMDKRCVGTILRFDIYTWDRTMTRLKRLKKSEPIIQVLWNTNQLGWIIADRVEVVSESR